MSRCPLIRLESHQPAKNDPTSHHPKKKGKGRDELLEGMLLNAEQGEEGRECKVLRAVDCKALGSFHRSSVLSAWCPLERTFLLLCTSSSILDAERETDLTDINRSKLLNNHCIHNAEESKASER